MNQCTNMCTLCNMSALDEHVDQILLSPAEALAAVRAYEQQGAVLALALRHVEAAGTFATEGAVSMNAWLRDKARMSPAAASGLLSTGRFLDTNSAFAQAALTGVLSASQITVAKQLAHPKYKTLLAERQAALVDALAPLAFGDTTRAIARWRQRADAELLSLIHI